MPASLVIHILPTEWYLVYQLQYIGRTTYCVGNRVASAMTQVECHKGGGDGRLCAIIVLQATHRFPASHCCHCLMLCARITFRFQHQAFDMRSQQHTHAWRWLLAVIRSGNKAEVVNSLTLLAT